MTVTTVAGGGDVGVMLASSGQGPGVLLMSYSTQNSFHDGELSAPNISGDEAEKPCLRQVTGRFCASVFSSLKWDWHCQLRGFKELMETKCLEHCQVPNTHCKYGPLMP